MWKVIAKHQTFSDVLEALAKEPGGDPATADFRRLYARHEHWGHREHGDMMPTAMRLKPYTSKATKSKKILTGDAIRMIEPAPASTETRFQICDSPSEMVTGQGNYFPAASEMQSTDWQIVEWAA